MVYSSDQKAKRLHRLMVVEDEPIVAKDLQERLQSFGYEVVGCVPSGEKALLLAGETRPDLVLMDIRLADKMDGIQVASRLGREYGIPVIYLTAFADKATIERARFTQPLGYLLKPFDEQQLLITLEIALYRLEAEKKLAQSEALFRSVYWQSPVGIALLDDQWRILDANPSCLELLGVTNLQEIYGLPVVEDSAFLQIISRRDLNSDTSHFELAFNFDLAKESWIIHTRKSGVIYLECLLTSWGGVGKEPASHLVHIQDVTERKLAIERIRHDALHDTLTQLPNRAYFIDQLRRAMDKVQRLPGFCAGVLFLDLDRFKLVNDSLGHAAGDRLLKLVAQRLLASVRPGDFVSRFGGDEFAILLDDIRSLQDAIGVSERIQQEINQPILLEGQEVFTSASIGIALVLPSHSQPDEILRDADTAMYQAKAHGKARYEIFNAEMHTQSFALFRLEADLRSAIERQQLTLYYQPIVTAKDRKISGVAAQIRWQHPQRGLLQPQEFMPTAEESGLLWLIDTWMVRSACRQFAEWQALAASPLRLFVSLSSNQARSIHVDEWINQILTDSGLPASSLELALKCGLLFSPMDPAFEVFQRLGKMGVQIAVYHICQSFYSPDTIKRRPASVFRLRPELVQGLPADQMTCQMVSVTIQLARALQLKVVAEGVETQEQLAFLSPQVDEVQGGVFYPAMPAQEFAAFLSRKP